MGNFSKLSEILTDTVFNKNAYSTSIKKAVAFGFWKDVVGSRFANFSIPYDIKGQTLFVAVKNPQVMQELIFNKTILLPKLRNYFTPLNMKVEEIRYDYKIWGKITSSYYLMGDETLETIENEEVEEVPLTNFEKEELSKVTNSISNLSFLSRELKERYAKNVINSIKARKLRAGGQ